MTLIEIFWSDDGDEAGAERLRLAREAAGVVRPTVGALQPALERGLRRVPVRTGLDAAVLANGFGARAPQVRTADLPEDRAWSLSTEWLGRDRVRRILAPRRRGFREPVRGLPVRGRDHACLVRPAAGRAGGAHPVGGGPAVTTRSSASEFPQEKTRCAAPP